MRIFLIALSILFGSFSVTDRAFCEEASVDVLNDLMDKGVKAYQSGDPVQCLKFFQQGIDLDRSNPAVHFMYGSFAYQIALDLKRQFAEKEMNLTALAAMEELSQTIRLGKDYKGDDPQIKNMTGHAAFLMGDLFHYLYNKPQLAWDYVAQPLQEYNFSMDVLNRVIKPKPGK